MSYMWSSVVILGILVEAYQMVKWMNPFIEVFASMAHSLG